MKAGDAFLQLGNRDERIHHTWVIISDPDQDAQQILLVNFTDADYWRDSACEILPGEHPSVTKRTRVAYLHAQVRTLTDLTRSQELGLLVQQGRLTPALLRKIRLGAWESEDIAFEHQDLLEEQGLGRDDILEQS